MNSTSECRLINEQLLARLTIGRFAFTWKSKSKTRKYLIIMTRASSSCNTLSKYIISRSDTIAPLITIISSPLIMPGTENSCTRNIYFTFLKRNNEKKQTIRIKIKKNSTQLFQYTTTKLGVSVSKQWLRFPQLRTVLHAKTFVLDATDVAAQLVLPLRVFDELGFHTKAPHLF